MGPKTASETQLNQQQALPVAGSVVTGETPELFTITGPSKVINPAPQATRAPETVPQPTYAPEAPTGTITPNVPGQEAIPQPQNPTQNGSEGYYQISTPQPDVQPQPAIYTESAPVPQNPTQNGSEGYYQTQLDPRVAQAQAQEAMAIPTEPIKLTPQEFSSVNSAVTPSPALESTSPVPTPEPVVVGADTSSPEFPGGSQDNLSPVAPTENSAEKVSNYDVMKLAVRNIFKDKSLQVMTTEINNHITKGGPNGGLLEEHERQFWSEAFEDEVRDRLKTGNS